ncbi:MAG: erythromycin esterase family protein [Myxococcota bacterium]
MFLFTALLACTRKDGGATPDETSAREPVAPGVWALDGLDEDLPPDDLAPFFDAVGDAQFVGLGETIHTSGGYQQAKFRLVKALVEEKGFRAVGYESPWEDILAAQKYVRTCRGSSDDALQEFLWVWEDIALRDMLEWMCEWNEEHPDDPVTIWGWDNQQPWDDGPLLDAYFAESAPADAPALSAGISTCLGVDRGDANGLYYSSDYTELYLTGVDEADNAACMAGLAAVVDYFDTNEAALVAATSEDALAWARVSLVGLEGWQQASVTQTTDCGASYEARDRANTYLLQEIHRLTIPDAKTVIWAHNAHLGFDTQSLTGRYGDPEGEAYVGGCEGTWEGMGTLLHASLGDAYRPFALAGYEVRIGWSGWDEPQVVPYDPRAAERLLHELGVGDAFVDFTADDSFFDDQPYEIAGWWQVVRDQYTGLIFIDSAWAMDWPLEDPFNAGCADDEVRVDGSVYANDENGGSESAAGTSICALDGPCTTAGAGGQYSLCVPAHTNAALSFDLADHGRRTLLISPDELGLLWDLAVYAESFNAGVYGLAGYPYPPVPGTGNASGYVVDANYDEVVGATISVSPGSGVEVVHFDADNVPYASQTGTGAGGWFLVGAMDEGWYDITVHHPDMNRCRLLTGNYTTEGTTLHVPVVDGVETLLDIQCTP